jgi:hypothetical protein
MGGKVKKSKVTLRLAAIILLLVMASSLWGLWSQLGAKADSVNFQVEVVKPVDFNGWPNITVDVMDGSAPVAWGNTNSAGDVLFSLPIGNYTFWAGNASTTASAVSVPATAQVGVVLMPTAAGTITINANAPYTKNTSVTLNLAVKDEAGVTGYRIANGEDASGGTAVDVASTNDFSADVPWTLPTGDGVKTVSMQYRVGANSWSRNSRDSILLDQTPPEITLTGVTDGDVVYLPDTITPFFSATDDLTPPPTVTAKLNGSPFDSGTTVSGAGHYTLIVTAEDQAGNIATLTVKFTIFSPELLKTDAIAELTALLPTGNKDTDKKIGEAIDHINKSLDPKLWASNTSLDTKDGDKVFNEEKDTVKKLLELEKDKKTPPEIIPELEAVIVKLLTADKLLAQTAINENSPNGKEIDKANKEMGKAADELDKGHPDAAIDHYKNAWKHAMKA